MLLAVDKPARITSFDVIRIFKRHFLTLRRNESSKSSESFHDVESIPTSGEHASTNEMKGLQSSKVSQGKIKIGHSGTLDPMATGLMILALDKDTKKLTKYIGLDKSYIATIDFSKITDTRDMEFREKISNFELAMKDGKIIGIDMEGGTIGAPTLGEITRKLDTLIPSHELPLPAFSAKKIAGKRSYDDARAGIIREEKKIMRTHGYAIISYDFPILQVKIDVGSGTYIRSIAYWLGQQLGIGGTLIQLRRTSIGDRDMDKLPNREELHNTYRDKEEIIRFTRL